VKKLAGLVAMTDIGSLTNNVIIATHIGSFATNASLHDFIIDKQQLQNYLSVSVMSQAPTLDSV
jgi:hypothetical protein